MINVEGAMNANAAIIFSGVPKYLLGYVVSVRYKFESFGDSASCTRIDPLILSYPELVDSTPIPVEREWGTI